MNRHTPGPWAAFTDDGHTNIVSVTPRTDCVFSLPGHDKGDPNVKLITAAPELLKWLQQAVLCLGPEDHEIRDGGLAAIAKATL